MKTKTAFSMNSETMLKENTASKEKSNRRSRQLTTAATNACTATITIGRPDTPAARIIAAVARELQHNLGATAISWVISDALAYSGTNWELNTAEDKSKVAAFVGAIITTMLNVAAYRASVQMTMSEISVTSESALRGCVLRRIVPPEMIQWLAAGPGKRYFLLEVNIS